jgi:uncharacterized protein (DUF952 family)
MRPLYHITVQSEVERAGRAGQYAPASLQSEGFIHCSYAEQLAAVADRYFCGQEHLALLEIDPRRVAARIVEENLLGEAQLYPHIYGPIPMSAVTAIRELASRPDGSFAWPCLVSASCTGSSSANDLEQDSRP